MIKHIVLMFLCCCVFAACSPNDPRLPAIVATKEGNALLQTEQYSLALNKYLEAMTYNPFRAELHLDAGLSFQGLQEAEKALQAFTEAEKLAEKSQAQVLVFMARFNKGVLLGAAKRVDEALEAYQSALEIYPTSIEVKTNIELLTQGQGGGGGGEGENQDQKQDPNSKDQKKNQQGQGDKKEDKKDGEGDQDKEEKEKQGPQSSPKYKPRPFEGKELSEGDVKKILGELKRQEEKIRAEYNKKDRKEPPRDKDW